MQFEHEHGAEILMTHEIENEMTGFAKNLVSEIRLHEDEKDAVDYVVNNFDTLADNFKTIQNVSKGVINRLWETAGTHIYQENVVKYLVDISQNINHYIKEKGDKTEKSIIAELSRANALRITLPEPYYVSEDGNTKHTDIWFIEPNGATLMKHSELFTILSNSNIQTFNANEYLKHQEAIMTFLVDSHLIKLQDGLPFTRTTLCEVKAHTLMFFFVIFSIFCKDGDFLKYKELHVAK
jgi:hypothetical protein